VRRAGAPALTRLTAAQTARSSPPARRPRSRWRRRTLDRIAAVDPALHAFLHIDSDGALALLATSTGPERPASRSRAAGVPLALKDVLTMRGVPTTCGSRSCRAGSRPTTPP